MRLLKRAIEYLVGDLLPVIAYRTADSETGWRFEWRPLAMAFWLALAVAWWNGWLA